MSTAQSTVSVRQAVFGFLRDAGMSTIFGNPGSTELPMFRDFPNDFRYMLGLQESIAVAMADGYAQATRNAAFVNLHSAVGIGHALGNVFTAWRNQTPLVIVAGQQARAILPFEPFLYADQPTEFPKPYVKWSCQPARAQDVPAAIARAYYTAMQTPRGPTFVSVPVDDWDRPSAPVERRIVSETVAGDPALLAEAADALARARSPAFVVGASAARDGAWHDLIALAERHRAPVWVSPMSGRNSFPEDHPLFAGFLAADRGAIVRALSAHDLIVAIGAPAFTYHVEGSGPFIPAGSAMIQLIDDPSMAAWSPVGTAIVTGIRLGVRALLNGPEPKARAEPKPMARPAARTGKTITDGYLLERIAALRPKGSIVVEEAPSSRDAMHAHLPIVDVDTFYTTASGGLGHGLPAAVGIALGRPGERVIAILGDGSAMYATQGLWSAAQLRLPITFVIIKNGAYEALNMFAKHFGLPPTVGTSLPQLDFCALAEGHGVTAVHVETPAALDDALRSAFASNGPILVEVDVEAGTSSLGFS